jgi:hypothetical protein
MNHARLLRARYVSVFCGMLSVSAPVLAQDRGELLYSTHCGACHTAKMHWRAGKAATDWPSLKAEVRRWQAAIALAWNEDDVLAVTRYLNDTVYHFQPAIGSDRASRGGSPGASWAAAPTRPQVPGEK